MNLKTLLIGIAVIAGIGTLVAVIYPRVYETKPEEVEIVRQEVEFLDRPAIERPEENANLILHRMDRYPHDVIGMSNEGREIRVYRFGKGDRTLAFVGAIHGGYEWNTALLAYQLIDFYNIYPERVPSDLSLAIIPVANPDGLYRTVGSWERFEFLDAPQFQLANEVVPTDKAFEGRFNANNVDLNRNFECGRKNTQASWRQYTVNAGPSAFSETETVILRDFFLSEHMTAAVFFHSASNGVYLASCNGEVLPGTKELRDVYAQASGYPSYETYDHYEITGAAEDWLSSIGVPTITVDLSTHNVIEWEENFAGVEALLKHYSTVQ